MLEGHTRLHKLFGGQIYQYGSADFIYLSGQQSRRRRYCTGCICKNKLNLFWNKNKVSIDDIAESAVYDEYNTGSEVLKAVMSLPPKYRIVIYMYYYEGYSTAEISKITAQKDSTVRSLLHRAKDKLRNILKEGYDFE